jgi:hypothetical protein
VRSNAHMRSIAPMMALERTQGLCYFHFYWFKPTLFHCFIRFRVLEVFMSYFIRFRVLESLICVLLCLGVSGYKYMLIASKKS